MLEGEGEIIWYYEYYTLRVFGIFLKEKYQYFLIVRTKILDIFRKNEQRKFEFNTSSG